MLGEITRLKGKSAAREPAEKRVRSRTRANRRFANRVGGGYRSRLEHRRVDCFAAKTEDRNVYTGNGARCNVKIFIRRVRVTNTVLKPGRSRSTLRLSGLFGRDKAAAKRLNAK